MAHDTPTLDVEKRDRIGSRYAQRLRKEGKLPAVVYGHGAEPVHVAADAKSAYDTLKLGYHLININLDGNLEPCLIKDIQFDYLGDTVIHLDLARVDLTEEVEVEVGLTFTGEPATLAGTPGAYVQHPHTEVLVSCKANNIPDEIFVDVTGLTVDEAITAGDLAMPEGVTLLSEPEMAVASMAVAQEEPEEDEAEATGDEPEVIGKADEAEEGEGENDED